MPIIIATKKSWAAHAYIGHFGEVLPEKPIPVMPFGTIWEKSIETKLILNSNEYLVSHNRFHFDITKNGKDHWECGKEPPPEFQELVDASLPLWEKYITGKKPYNT